MMVTRLGQLAGLFLLVAVSTADAAPAYSIKIVKDSAPPKELREPIRKLLDTRCVQLLDGKGTTLIELWFRKELPVKATEAQVKNGLTYREVPPSSVIGAMRVARPTIDYRKQKINAGVYTLRLAVQPMDGDHMGTAPYNEFCLICPAADDKKPDLMEAKQLHELSGKSTESHPGVFLLFPGKEARAEPKLLDKGEGHWVLFLQLDARAGDLKARFDLGLTLIGVSSSA
jgi:hypothetical protein